MKHILRCKACNKFTMKQTCTCGNITLSTAPLKYSPEDKLAVYRRMAKIDEYKKRGLA